MRRCIANENVSRQGGKYKAGEEVTESYEVCNALVLLGNAEWVEDDDEVQHQRKRGRPTNAEREARLKAEGEAKKENESPRAEQDVTKVEKSVQDKVK